MWLERDFKFGKGQNINFTEVSMVSRASNRRQARETGQTTVNKKAPIHYVIPINDMVHRPLWKCLKISNQKFHDKAAQCNMLWLNLNKIGEISILQSAHKQGNPSFRFHAPGSKRRYPCSQTASAVPKYFPCLLQFCTGYRIWHASRVWRRKTSEKRKNFQDTTHTFSLFLDEFL